MADRSVLYRKQADVLGDQTDPVGVDVGVAKVKQMATLRADRSYKNGRKRKSTDQTIEIVVHLGIDPRQADQALRGAISLPKGIGKTRKVIAFCDGAMAEAAKAAGAVEAGADELIDKVQKGWFEFDVAIAHPSLMGKVGKLGRVLGPQGKMPTPKAGTVTPDVLTAVKEFGAGRIEFRNDDGGNVHLPVGKASFPASDLKDNIDAVLKHLNRIKPASSKGHYIKKVTLSGTRTPGVQLSLDA
ncbi:MAG: 50S ribosomal protein L1 [Planctomycetota bacterium]